VTAAVRPGRPAWAGQAAAYDQENSIERVFEPAYPGRVAAYLPPGWPAGVHPPGTDGFEQTAVTWLLDVLPADYRVHGVLRRHPVALAAVARHYLDACVAGARSGYRGARTELTGALPPQAVEAVLQVYQDEGRRLVDAARAVDLVGRALRGETFTPALAQGRPAKRRPAGN
jgi:hypothetical protein